MKAITGSKLKYVRITMAVLLIGSVVAAGCSGGARINVDVDPETGEGSIDVVGAAEAGADGGNQAEGGEGANQSGGSAGQGGNVQISDAVIFATVIALFLGVLAIVISTANRPRYQ